MNKCIGHIDYTEALNEYEQLLQTQYDIINKELFDGILKPIKMVHELFLAPKVLAQVALPEDEPHYMAFSFYAFQGLMNDYAIDYFCEYNEQIDEEELEDEMKQAMAGTLIHEMIHQYGIENGIEDTVPDYAGGYHTETFRDIAKEKGLLVLEAENGWSNTHINPSHPILKLIPFKNVLKYVNQSF